MDAPRLADLVIKAGAIYSMAENRKVYRAIALRGEWIVAVSEDRDGLDNLISGGTRVLDDPDLTLLPAFNDSHNHFILAAEAINYVQVDSARSIADLVELIRQRAAETPPDQWIRSSDAWSETNLAEGRMPTAAELDRATQQHPVWVKRGGHVGSANSLALQLAGITRETADPPHGKIRRLPDGSPEGELEAAPALTLIEKLIPISPFEQRVADLGKACQNYNAYGIGTVRDPIVSRDQMMVYQALWERGELTVRSRPMFLVQPGPVADRLREIEGLGVRSGFGDNVLKIWGLKSLMDGGAASAALDAPYADNPQNSGNVFWKTEDLVEVANFAVRRGWRFGIHALGDRAVRSVIDAYEQVIKANPTLRPGTFAIEHAFLADSEQRARAIRLGIAITVQQPLVYALGAQLVQKFGEQRTAQVMPIGAWVKEGAQVSAGTDSPPSSPDPLLAVWGMVTRNTRQIGVQGPEYAIDRYTAFQLYTLGSAQFYWEDQQLGTLQPQRLADLIAYRTDPITCPVDDLRKLRPALTIVGGRVVHDPDAMIDTIG